MRVTNEGELPTGLPPGVLCMRAGEAIEHVETKAGTVRLLANGGGTELAECTLTAGDRLNLLPATPPGGVAEAYYVLAGTLAWREEEREFTFRPGDCIAVENLAGPVVLTATEDVRFLYVTSRPSFHQISDTLHDLMRLAEEVEVADGYTAGHCLRLQRLAYATARTLGLDGSRLVALDHGAYLHDLGKVKIPRPILRKPGPLTADEWALVKRHPIFGRELLEHTSLRHAASIVEQHHERVDGSGYPYGLSGNEVLVEASIVAVADTYDAMTTDRVYRRALSREAALDEIARLAGKQLPREVVKAFQSSNASVGEELNDRRGRSL